MSECVNNEVHIGQRVEAVWKPEDEWDFAMDNIAYWSALDEPDVGPERVGRLSVDGSTGAGRV